MIYNCKERFGYTYLWTSDKKMQSLLFAYCGGIPLCGACSSVGEKPVGMTKCSFGFRPARLMNF